MNVLLVGTGRAAFHLGHALLRSGHSLSGVAGRDPERTHRLADELGTVALAISDARTRTDLRILAVSDDAISSVSSLLPRANAATIHLSGARSYDLIGMHAHRGVLWPIQSFSPGEPMDFRTVPLVLDAEDESTRSLLRQLAHDLSAQVIELGATERQLVHIAAVLTSNFPVQLLIEARQLLRDTNIPTDLLTPLWTATAAKAATHAESALTGPARRGDQATIASHLARLSGDADLRAAYQAITYLILRDHQPGSDRANEGRAEQAG